MEEQHFFVADMLLSRPADYCIGYSNGSVFIDFIHTSATTVCLKRISFDGYGCCELGVEAIGLNEEDSRTFTTILKEGVNDQKMLSEIVKKTIAANKGLIWLDALKEYELI